VLGITSITCSDTAVRVALAFAQMEPHGGRRRRGDRQRRRVLRNRQSCVRQLQGASNLEPGIRETRQVGLEGAPKGSRNADAFCGPTRPEILPFGRGFFSWTVALGQRRTRPRGSKEGCAPCPSSPQAEVEHARFRIGFDQRPPGSAAAGIIGWQPESAMNGLGPLDRRRPVD